jgi:hypothetical protein
MKKVISFSLFGNNDKYTLGAIKNADLHNSEKIYSDWTLRFYVNSTVPKDIIDTLKDKGAEIIDMSDSYLNKHGTIWRFLVLEDNEVDVFIVRDTDSRISKREENAVNEWLESNKLIHIIRDHLDHFHDQYPIQCGLWGYKNYMKRMTIHNLQNFIMKNPTLGHFDDAKLLTEILSKYDSDMLIHDNWLRTDTSVKFKDKRSTRTFVGDSLVFKNDEEVSLWPSDRWTMTNGEHVPLGKKNKVYKSLYKYTFI